MKKYLSLCLCLAALGASSLPALAQTTLSGDHIITGNLDVGVTGTARNLNVTGTASVDGRVGIGTATPSQQLEITGNFRIPLTTSSTAGVIFSGSSRIFHTYGTQNLFIGVNAGNFSGTGQNNFGFGTRALDALTGGSFNFAFGTDVLGKVTTGGYNVGIGSGALQELTNANGNIAIGNESLRYTTTSWNNVGIGMYALMNFNGGGGVGIGFAAGQNATGVAPTFIGYQAGRAITSGQFNTAIGWEALDTDGTTASTNGSFRTAIGAGAQVTSNNTVAIGGTGTFAANTIFGGTAAAAKVHIIQTAEQLRVGYDNSNYFSTTTGSNGAVTFDAVGAGASFSFSDEVNFPGKVTVSGTMQLAGVLAGSSLNGMVFGGTFGSGSIPVEGAGTRMMWYPGKGAFRAGMVSGTQWNDGSVGAYSIALGIDNIASGTATTALGSASAATGQYSFAGGEQANAAGKYSFAFGAHTIASGMSSIALGEATTASGYSSVAIGALTTAGGDYAAAFGLAAQTSGMAAFSSGIVARADSVAAAAFGSLNVGGGDPEAFVEMDPLFEIGNGRFDTDEIHRNALTVFKNGKLRTSNVAEFRGGARVAPQGDLSMGEFTAGDNPADLDPTTGLKYSGE